MTVVVLFGGKPSQFKKGGVDVDQADGAIAFASRSCDARCDDDEGDAIGFLPEGELHAALLVAEMISVIGPEDDDGVVGTPAGVELVEETPHHLIGEIGGGLVTLHHALEAAGAVGFL